MSTSAAQFRGTRKAARDLFQVVVGVVAGGGAYALLELIVDTVHPSVGVILAFVFKILTAFAQNYLETKGSIGVMLPTPGLVVAADDVADHAVATVDAVVDEAGGIIGAVTDTAGEVIGAVTGQTTDEEHNP